MRDATIESLLARYAQANDVEMGTLNWLRTVARRFSKFLKRPATIADLNENTVNGWLTAILAEGLGRITVKSYRGAIIMLWRFAADENLCDAPRKIKTIKVPKAVPLAWSVAEVRRLLAQAQAMPGYYECGVAKAAFWAAFILVLWDSAVRLGDLLKLRWDEIGASGLVVKSQKKTGWPTAFRLSESTIAALGKIRRVDEPLIFGGVVCRDTVFATMRKLTAGAGLKGGSKKVRKSAASEVERMRPGDATRLLGHKTPTMARDFYVDPRIAQADPPRPTPLIDAG